MSIERLDGDYTAGEYQLSSEVLGDENILVLNSSKSSRFSFIKESLKGLIKPIKGRIAIPAGVVLLTVAAVTMMPDVSSARGNPNLGDVNCDGNVNSIDAALVLQKGAGLIDSLACEEAGDVNGDDLLNAVDAALILQLDAGIIDEL